MLRVLVVEDEPLFMDLYTELLSRLGYFGVVVTGSADARAHLRSDPFDVIILDRRSRAGRAPEDDLGWLDPSLSQSAHVYLVSGPMRPEAVTRAFEHGVTHCLERSAHLLAHLQSKLDAERKWVRARLVDPAARQRCLQALWRRLDEGAHEARARRLEDLVLLMFASVPGWSEAWTRLAAQSKLLDMGISLDGTASWAGGSRRLGVGCRRWSEPASPTDLGWFADKLRERSDVRIGFYVALLGFTEPVQAHLRSFRRREGRLIVPLLRRDLARLVQATPADRGVLIARLHAGALADTA